MSQSVEKTYNTLNLILGSVIGASLLAVAAMWLYQNGDSLSKKRDEWFQSSVKIDTKANQDYLKPFTNSSNQVKWDTRPMQQLIENNQRMMQQFQQQQPRFGRMNR